MDYIFDDWKKTLSNFESSVEKDLKEIRQCKAEIQGMKVELINQMKKGHYLRDDNRLVLSAPEVIIGNVDESGKLLSGGYVVMRGQKVGMQASGEGGQIEIRASSIREIAEDPGIDGLEHVVGGVSEVVSQARNIIIQSDDAQGTFSAPTISANGCGVRIHADNSIVIDATATAESREKRLDSIIKEYETQKGNLKKLASEQKDSFGKLVKEMEDLLKQKEDITKDDEEVRSGYQDLFEIDDQIESLSLSLSELVASYTQSLSLLAEVNRQIKCFKDEKGKIKKGDDFKQNSTGTSVSIVSERINLASSDGEGNLRDNDGSGIGLLANDIFLRSVETDGKLKENGKLSIQAKTVEVTTAGLDKAEFEDNTGELNTAEYVAEGDIILKSKNISLESMDYEVKEKKLQEKALTADGKISVRAKTVEVSTENSANVEVDEQGKLTKANYTSEGDLLVRSKTVTVESIDYDLENGERKEKALTQGGALAIRAEKMDLSATDTEGKATGNIDLNAKAISVKTMDVEKEKRTDDKLAAGSTVILVSEKMFVGAKSKDVKSKKVQVVSEEVGAFADNTLEIQQGDGKSLVQLAGGNASVGGSKTQLFGDTTINGKTEIKGDVTAPKGTFDNLEAKTSFKSQNITDGIAVPAPAAGGSLSAKLKAEDAPA
ncbi:MAG: hypothetical protein J6U14_10830 [Bacteroidaceae bacterium]|nr:hypothetical protein [Bacteroidaceae bacterium]